MWIDNESSKCINNSPAETLLCMRLLWAQCLVTNEARRCCLLVVVVVVAATALAREIIQLTPAPLIRSIGFSN